MQRVKRARVLVGDEEVGAVGVGLLVLVGAMKGDGPSDAAWLARKLLSLRIFSDEAGKMNRSIREVAGQCLVVSQFTLCADTSGGSRPSFGPALDPESAERLVEDLVREMGREVPVATGRFGASMGVELVNDGPVTLWLDSRAKA